MRRNLAIVVALSGLAACVSPEADLKRAGGICEAGGHKLGTASYQACISDEVAKIEDNRRYTAAAIGGAMQNYSRTAQGNTYASPPTYTPTYARRPVNCTSNVVGSYTYTNCY